METLPYLDKIIVLLWVIDSVENLVSNIYVGQVSSFSATTLPRFPHEMV